MNQKPGQASGYHIFRRFFESDVSAVGVLRDTAATKKTIFIRFFHAEKPSIGDINDEVGHPQALSQTELVPVATQESIEGYSESVPEESVSEEIVESPEKETTGRGSLLYSLKAGLSKTRAQFSGKILQLFSNKPSFDESLIESIETQLLMADVGMSATQKIVAHLSSGADQVIDQEKIKERLKGALLNCLDIGSTQAFLAPKNEKSKTQVVLVVGVNGVGKTTTIGKLALRFKTQGKSVMLAAGDTFRAAAVEQLQVWGERNQVPVISQATGADSASVIYDALSSAQSKGVDVLIADTAGRLHNKSNLMEELKKIQRVMKKLDASAPHETLLVVDGCTGQNALSQGREFDRAMGLTGIVITKLDGTAKGGILFALVDALQVPVRFIGVGEKAEDLRDFSAEDFIDALIDV